MIIKLDRPLPVVQDIRLIGFDTDQRQPVLDTGNGGPWTLAQMQRAGWDSNEERFTDGEIASIYDAIRTLGLPPELVNAPDPRTPSSSGTP